MRFLFIPIVTAIIIQVTCQIFKFILYSVRDRKAGFHYLVTAGGVPSAHSAFVTSLCTSIAFVRGLDSSEFSVAAVFALIVVYDAYRLRGHVQSHAVIINRLLEKIGEAERERVSEMVGHSVPEIAWGILYGGIATALVYTLGPGF